MKIEIEHSEISTICKVDGVNLYQCERSIIFDVKKILRKLSKVDKRICNGINKQVQQYTLNGEFVKEFISSEEAFRETKIKASSIRACCSGKRNTAGKYQWKYVNSDKEIKSIGYVIFQYSKDGSLLNIFDSIAEASKETNIVYPNISQNIRGDSKSANGFIFKKIRRDQLEFIKSLKK